MPQQFNLSTHWQSAKPQSDIMTLPFFNLKIKLL